MDSPPLTLLARTEIERVVLARKAWWARMGITVFVVFATSWTAFITWAWLELGDSDAGEGGALVFKLFSTVVGWGALFLGPLFGSTAIHHEMRAGSLETLLLVGYRPFAVLVGKAGSAIALVTGLLLCTTPVLWLALVLGGAEGKWLLALAGWVILAATWGTCLGLLAGTAFRSTLVATLVAELFLGLQLAAAWALGTFTAWFLPGEAFLAVLGWVEPTTALWRIAGLLDDYDLGLRVLGEHLAAGLFSTGLWSLAAIALGAIFFQRSEEQRRRSAVGRWVATRTTPESEEPDELVPDSFAARGFTIAVIVLVVIPALVGLMDRWILGALGGLVPAWMGARSFTTDKRTRAIEILATTPAKRHTFVWARAKSILRVVPFCAIPVAFQILVEVAGGGLGIVAAIALVGFVMTGYAFLTYLGIAASLAVEREDTAILLVAIGLLAYAGGASMLGLNTGIYALGSTGVGQAIAAFVIGFILSSSNLIWAFFFHLASSEALFRRAATRSR